MDPSDATRRGGREVRPLLDEVSGRVVALGAGALRVLSEIRTAYNKPVVKRKGRRRTEAASGSAKGSRRKSQRAARPGAEKASLGTKKAKSRSRSARSKTPGTKTVARKKEK